MDHRRRFTLSPKDFALLNPNTRTCPVFRSQADAELTKKLYRATPVLWQEELKNSAGDVVQVEHNPWGIQFQLMFMMNTDSGLFKDRPAASGQPPTLPLYEAKMMHQFDHRWATYIDAVSNEVGKVETVEVGPAQKADPAFAVRPRYWVDEGEVLARIARVPSRVARAWLALHTTQEATQFEAEGPALADLLRALAQWVVGELFHRTAGAPPLADGWTPAQAQPHIASSEAQLKARFPRLNDVLLGDGLTTKKALVDFPKWATQNFGSRLADDELTSLAEALHTPTLANQLYWLLKGWIDLRSPRWLMGWRDITNATNERTVIASVVPRAGVGNNMPLMLFGQDSTYGTIAALLGNLCCLTLDFVARHKVGGIHLNYFIYKQLPVLPPDRYTPAALDFIVPRVLELTYTAHDLKHWADGLAAYDPRPIHERGHPFSWNSERRAQLRAELDACYARLYGLTREELRYILDPTDVRGADC